MRPGATTARAALLLVAGTAACATVPRDRVRAPSIVADAGAEPIVVSAIPAGLEACLPPHGAYRRALDAVHAARYRQAYERFLDAAGEVREAFDRGPRPRRTEPCGASFSVEDRVSRSLARTLLRKLSFIAEEARIVAEAESLGAFAPAPEPPPPRANAAAPATSATKNPGEIGFDLRLRATLALHNLYLTDRAFFRRSDDELWHRTNEAFLALTSSSDGARSVRAALGHAALYADAGLPAQALGEFLRVPTAALGPEHVDLVAHYYAAIGDPERAFAVISDARDALSEWPEIRQLLLVANDLDPLREDPRFGRLVGEAE